MPWEGILQLIARAKAGHDDAWGSLHEMVRPYLLNQAQSLLGTGWQNKSVSDLTQETWLHVTGGIQGFRSGDDDQQTAALFRAWLRKIMKHIFLNWIRDDGAQRRKAPLGIISLNALSMENSADGSPGLEPIADQSSISAGLRREERHALIRRVLDELPDRDDRDLVQLHFFEGLSLREIARRRGVSDGTIGNRMQSILELLLPDLEKLR